jgi:hypothetical protein
MFDVSRQTAIFRKRNSLVVVLVFRSYSHGSICDAKPVTDGNRRGSGSQITAGTTSNANLKQTLYILAGVKQATKTFAAVV